MAGNDTQISLRLPQQMLDNADSLCVPVARLFGDLGLSKTVGRSDVLRVALAKGLVEVARLCMQLDGLSKADRARVVKLADEQYKPPKRGGAR